MSEPGNKGSREWLESLSPRERELRNAEVIQGIFESGSETERQELQELHGFSPEQMKDFIYWAGVRKGVKNREQEQVTTRKAAGKLELTNEEQGIGNMGVMIEKIEPQVREALRTLWAKGYKTTYSGFEAFGTHQTIWFDKTQGPPPEIPAETKTTIESSHEITITTKDDRWVIDFSRTRLSLDEITKIWNTIKPRRISGN